MSSGKSELERPIEDDDVLDALADEHRRAVLRVLEGADSEALPFDALAAAVCAELTNRDAMNGVDGHRRRVTVALHSHHVPKLEDYGVVRREEEPETDRVRLADADRALDLLRRLDATRPRQLR